MTLSFTWTFQYAVFDVLLHFVGYVPSRYAQVD